MRLGVDPGGVGGAVLRAARSDEPPVWWAAWSQVASGWRLRTPSAEATRIPTLHGVGLVLGARALELAGGPVEVVVEGLFARGQSSLVLAERTGALISGLQASGCVARLQRPLAVERRRGRMGWRQSVLGLPRSLSADRAEAIAVGLARRQGWLPHGLTFGEQGAVAEAGFIALATGESGSTARSAARRS